MKHLYNILIGGISLFVGLSSCEMKNELAGEKGVSDEKGLLEIGVSYNDKVNIVPTKAVESNPQPPQDANGFKVDIAGKDYEESFTYQTGEPVSVELPVGTYTVYAHSDLEKKQPMDEPYYGKRETVKIEAGQSIEKEILCKMENTKFQVVFDDKFHTDFSSCELTITAGTCVIPITSLNDENQNKYWMLDEGVKKIEVRVKAWTKNGNVEVNQSFTFSKEDGEAYTGSDIIVFNMTSSGDVTSGSAKISVTVSLFEDLGDEVVNIPVEGEETTTPPDPGTDPEEPGEKNLTMKLPDDITFTTGNSAASADAKIEINTPEGIKSLIVTIKSGNEGFGKIVKDLGEFGVNLETGEEMVNNTDLSAVLKELSAELPEIETPKKGDEKYDFPIGVFLSLMDVYGPTDEGSSHVFEVVLEDLKGDKLTDELKVTINDK